MNTLAASSVTAEELLRLSHPGKRVELVRGELVVREPPAAWRSWLPDGSPPLKLPRGDVR